VAPDAVKVVDEPLQIVKEEAETEIVGVVITVTAIVLLDTQPAALVPLTV
jgi:hypothetical protein